MARSPRPLRIGIDAEALRTPLSGVGHYTFQICEALAKEIDADFFAYGRLGAERLSLPIPLTLRQEAHPLARKLPSFIWLKTRGRALALKDYLDAFWAPRTLHPSLPLQIRTLSTVHDLNHLVVPETMERVTRVAHRLFFRRDAASAHWLMTNSKGTAKRLKAHLGLSADDIVHPGLHPRFRPLPETERPAALASIEEAFGVRPPYFLTVATLEPRKNLPATLRAFLQLKRAGYLRRHQLVLVGSMGWGSGGLFEEIQSARKQGVIVTGYVPDEALPMLYALSEALIFPSLYEGFGMPVMEARACGTRAIISGIPELLEAAGEGAMVVDPTQAGIQKTLALFEATADTPPRQPAIQGFSWSQASRQLAEALRAQAEARDPEPAPARAAP